MGVSSSSGWLYKIRHNIHHVVRWRGNQSSSLLQASAVAAILCVKRVTCALLLSPVRCASYALTVSVWGSHSKMFLSLPALYRCCVFASRTQQFTWLKCPLNVPSFVPENSPYMPMLLSEGTYTISGLESCDMASVMDLRHLLLIRP